MNYKTVCLGQLIIRNGDCHGCQIEGEDAVYRCSHYTPVRIREPALPQDDTDLPEIDDFHSVLLSRIVEGKGDT